MVGEADPGDTVDLAVATMGRRASGVALCPDGAGSTARTADTRRSGRRRGARQARGAGRR